MSHVRVFTDGSSRGNPGPGGWGAIVTSDSLVHELGGHEAHTTNNRMELKAAHEALVCALDLSPKTIDIYTDSSYVLQGATQWGAGWRRNNWVTATKKPVLNRDLWEPFLSFLDRVSVPIVWHNVGGHVGIPGNERADEIATSYADGVPAHLYAGPRLSYTVDVSVVAADTELAAKKSDARSRSNTKAYSYVSEVDGVVQVHASWAECEARVRGKKARFKKALSLQEEQEIVRMFSS